jgi:hypothetical protein
MIFKNLKMLFDSFYLTKEADTISKNNKIINGIKVKINLKVKSKNKRIFFIIQRTPGAGIFSNLIFVLNYLNICKTHGFTPIVDMKNYPTIYNEREKILGSLNSWDYYFDPVSSFTLEEAYKSGKFLTCSNLYYKKFETCSKKIKKIFKEYIKIKKNYLNQSQDFANKYIKGNKVLAVHYRGTSYKTSAGHPYPPTFDQMKNAIDYLIKYKKYNKIFLCTEDLIMFKKLKNFYGSKIIFTNSFRSNKDDSFKVYPRKNHRYKLGKEILIEALIISKCNGFISTESNVSNFVNIIKKNNKPKFYKIENGYNSTNEYYAMYLWYLKKLLPSFLGGFGKSIKISNPKLN